MAATLSPVWELSRTTNDLIGISTGFLQAATADNVQPIALLACREFGATLPMSQETRSAVRALCSQGHQNQLIEHLKLQVGYRKDDCGWQLCQNDAGLRFLGLAACLLTVDRWSAAQTLQELIIGTARDKQLVPTARQLQDLLTALQSRLGRSDFLKNVVGWQLVVDKLREQSMLPHCAPSGAIIQKLVEALSSLHRLGDHRRHSLQIEVAHLESAWVIAFVKWLLGRPPNVQYGNKPEMQAESRVTVIPCDDDWAGDDDLWGPDQRLQITVRDEFDSILELMTAGGPVDECLGLVPVTTLGDSFVTFFGPLDSPRWPLALDMISYGCSALLEHVRTGKGGRVVPDGITVQTTATYPLESEISSTMAQFLALPPGNVLKKQPPVCSQYVEAMQQLADNGEDIDDIALVAKKCIATIFVLSLSIPNASPDPLLVVYECPGWGMEAGFEPPEFLDKRFWDALQQDVHIIIDDRPGAETKKGVSSGFVLSPYALFQSALRLLGHNIELRSTRHGRTHDYLAISSFSGQTAFPSLLHSLDLKRKSHARIFYMHGDILWKDDKYNKVTTHTVWAPGQRNDDLDDDPWIPLSKRAKPQAPNLEKDVPYDAFQDCKLAWQVSCSYDKLQIILGSSFCEDMVDPMVPFAKMHKVLFVDCQHDRHERFPFINGHYHSGQKIHKVVPIFAQGSSQAGLLRIHDQVGMVCSGNNQKARFYALCAFGCEPVVVRGNACVECCIKVCMQMKENRLIIC
ncbi:hypothetical protein PV11_03706 [Exophiala sideris]|uniref:Uncharacterized protein n=1 Tax=Exophiala sideris TaxID=1016849 RepID=A0A0D1Z3V4_9EURO|nr:hypothetical protein PV11_03706 [Exophiala sideris]